MKIIVIGATGTIGTAVVQELSLRHEVVSVGKSHGDFSCDITQEKSLHALFQHVGPFDALVSTVGKVHFAPFKEMTASLYEIGLRDKLMGQVNLVLIGRQYIKTGGSFTLTSGILAHDPIRAGSSASMVNGAIESFVQAAAIEMAQGMRINAVSPSIITESLDAYGPYFYGFESTPARRAAVAYSKSVEGLQTGQIYRV